MQIRQLTSDADIAAATDLMLELRPHLNRASFAQTIRNQESGGYILVGGFVTGELATLAGYRLSSTLFRGPHLFIDDLVTKSTLSKRGHATQMLAWLAAKAIEAGVADVWLDSRSTARGFYEQVGFEMKNSIPCRMDAKTLAAKSSKS